MTVQEIFDLEKQNQASMFLIKKGCFWRAYEKSAFRFESLIKKYRVTKNFYKNIQKEIVCLGFPTELIFEILIDAKKKNLSVLHQSEFLIEIGKIPQIVGFEDWKAKIEIRETDTSNSSLQNKILNFPLFQKTPLDAMIFLRELQVELKD